MVRRGTIISLASLWKDGFYNQSRPAAKFHSGNTDALPLLHLLSYSFCVSLQFASSNYNISSLRTGALLHCLLILPDKQPCTMPPTSKRLLTLMELRMSSFYRHLVDTFPNCGVGEEDARD